MTQDNKPFGSEIEVDNVVYVSVDFLLQYPEYLDNELDEQVATTPNTAGPEEGDTSASIHRSEMTINGVPYVALPVVKQNPNVVELKYRLKKDVELPTFIPENLLGEAQMAAISRRRRHS